MSFLTTNQLKNYTVDLLKLQKITFAGFFLNKLNNFKLPILIKQLPLEIANSYIYCLP